LPFLDRYWILAFQEYPNSEIENIQNPETSIKDQPMLAMIFVEAIQREQEILCSYRVFKWFIEISLKAYGKLSN